MTKQIFYEDIEEQISQIPPLVKHPTRRQLVKWAGASGDYYEIHYDKDFALANGLSGVIVHGWLVLSFLGQMLTDWAGLRGDLVKLSCKYRGMHFPDEDLICRGKVIRKFVQGGKYYVEADVWTENSQGQAVVSGNAVIDVPSKVNNNSGATA